ncbi:MAG: class I SAM-dependent methyltransferase [Actinomycetota bacterium]|nr:class I SAM-dependent methyltransferase [Actinomycetota bacterium]
MSRYDAFAPIYDRWAAQMREDVSFYVDLARVADGPVVELAVGSGRVAIPVAHETGRSVLGLDSSSRMLAVARQRAEKARVEVELREGDMRDLELEEPAGLVYCPFRSLLHLPTWRDRRRVFERVAAALRPGGRFAWNAFVFDPILAAELHERERERTDTGIRERVTYVPADARIEIEAWDGDETEPRRLSLWWIARSEWEGLIDVAGLETDALYGWFDRRPFDDESREFVWVTRKPAV